MSVIRLLSARLHAAADYAVAVLLILVPLLVGGSTLAVATGVVIGIVVAVISSLTRYPLGLVKVLPFTVHSLGDYLAVVLLAVAPFALHFSATDHVLTLFYEAAALAVLVVSLITDYQFNPDAAGSTANPQAVPVPQTAAATQVATVPPAVTFAQVVTAPQVAVPEPQVAPASQVARIYPAPPRPAVVSPVASADQLSSQVSEAAWAEQERLARESARAEQERLAREAAWAEEERKAQAEQERLALEAARVEHERLARKASWAAKAALDEQVAHARQAYQAALAQQAVAHQADQDWRPESNAS